jgi:hypothetical protein
LLLSLQIVFDLLDWESIFTAVDFGRFCFATPSVPVLVPLPQSSTLAGNSAGAGALQALLQLTQVLPPAFM